MIDKNLYEKIKKLTRTDYELHDYICDSDDFSCMLEDLIYIIEDLKDKIDNLEEDIRENYRPIPYTEQIGYNERDFY